MNQAIAFKLADMKMQIDAARLLVWRACWMGSTGKQFTAGEGSMSKLYAGEVAVKATEEAIQILGGAGYVKEHPVEQWHRDSKIYTIFEGTSPRSSGWWSPAASLACTFPDLGGWAPVSNTHRIPTASQQG